MKPNHQFYDAESAITEFLFVQESLAATDKSERASHIAFGTLAFFAILAFIWAHIHTFAPDTLGVLLHSTFRGDLVFMAIVFAIAIYLRQSIIRNTRCILRAISNTCYHK